MLDCKYLYRPQYTFIFTTHLFSFVFIFTKSWCLSVMEKDLSCCFQHILIVYFLTAKKNKKKGKTLTLTDFLAEDSRGNAPPSYAPAKPTSWADETDDLEGDGEIQTWVYTSTTSELLTLCFQNVLFLIFIFYFDNLSSGSFRINSTWRPQAKKIFTKKINT